MVLWKKENWGGGGGKDLKTSTFRRSFFLVVLEPFRYYVNTLNLKPKRTFAIINKGNEK